MLLSMLIAMLLLCGSFTASAKIADSSGDPIGNWVNPNFPCHPLDPSCNGTPIPAPCPDPVTCDTCPDCPEPPAPVTCDTCQVCAPCEPEIIYIPKCDKPVGEICSKYSHIIPYITADAGFWTGAAFTNESDEEIEIVIDYPFSTDVIVTIPAKSIETLVLIPDEVTYARLYSKSAAWVTVIIGKGCKLTSYTFELDCFD